MSDTTLTIQHDYESGTTVEGTAKNSPAHMTLKAHPSWTWSRFARAWLLRSSRHRQSKPGPIAEVERILTGLGYAHKINDTMPSVAEQENDLADRMDQRQEIVTCDFDGHVGDSGLDVAADGQLPLAMT